MPDSKYFKFAVWVLLIFLIILVGTHISFIFRPLIILFNTLFFPVFLAGVFYFLARPVVNWLNNKKVPRTLAILVIYLVFFGLVSILALSLGPVIQYQATNLINNIPAFISFFEREIIALQENPMVQRLQTSDMLALEDLAGRLTSFLGSVFSSVGENIASFVGAVANLVVIIVIVPFILFYMLRDGQHLPGNLLRWLPSEHIDDGRRILSDMDRTLSTYIRSLMIVCLCVGIMIYIGLLIIGLEYALLLALFAMLTNVIPYIGPFIGAIPAVIVAIADSPLMVVKVLVVVFIAQQIESSLISPQVMGRKMAIHPLIIITVLLIAGRFAGFWGMILAVPTYAIMRVVLVNTYSFYRLHVKNVKVEKESEPG